MKASGAMIHSGDMPSGMSHHDVPESRTIKGFTKDDFLGQCKAACRAASEGQTAPSVPDPLTYSYSLLTATC
jgi:hypothetical protein